MVKIYRKTLRQSGRANGDATLMIISDRQSFLDADKAVFADTLRAIEYALDVRKSYPTHIDMYLGQSRALIEMEERQATSPETAPTDLLTHTKPQATMDDLVVAPTLKDEIEEVIFYCTHKTAVDEQVDPSARKSQGLFINFHGASGTGKTLAAEIIAARLGKDLLIVNYANLESELVGRTSKNIHQIFKFAIDSDCILMFDEADSFLSARISALTTALTRAGHSS